MGEQRDRAGTREKGAPWSSACCGAPASMWRGRFSPEGGHGAGHAVDQSAPCGAGSGEEGEGRHGTSEAF